MKTNNLKRNLPVRQINAGIKDKLEGYPAHSAGEDIYNVFLEKKDIDPEDISKNKEPNESEEINTEKSGIDFIMGRNLDVPGAELDDSMENIGSEDEENNYYSIGGDDHNDLEENQGVK